VISFKSVCSAILFANVSLQHVVTCTCKHDQLCDSDSVINAAVYVIVDCWPSKLFIKLKWDETITNGIVHTYIQGVSGGIVNVLGGGSMDYSD
jgi:hypothetical protein